MNRQERRRTKRFWDELPSLIDGKEKGRIPVERYDCTGKLNIEELPHTAVDFQIKVCSDLLLEYNLDMFQRWRLYVVVVVDGFYFRGGLWFPLGVASEAWLVNYFEDF
jgi:hypothetical protein